MSNPVDARIPQDATAEASVLGSILIDSEALWKIRADLKPGDFYDKRNGAIYAAMLALADAGEPIDYLTVSGALKDAGKFAQDGVSGYVAGLIEATPSAVNVLGYATRVVTTSRQRQALAMLSEGARRVYAEPDELDKTLTWLAQTAAQGGRGGEVRQARDMAGVVYDELSYNVEHPLAPGQVRGVDTGWRDLNAKLGGWKPGLYVTLGEPHVGKTFFLIQAAANVAATGRRALVFSLEMTAKQLVTRLCLSDARITSQEYDLGRVPDHKWPAFSARIGDVTSWDLDIVDDLETASSIFATIHRECRSANPPALICIDYLGLIVTDYGRESVNYETSALLRAMKNLTAQVRVPILTAHQISDKAIEARANKRPQKADGYGSGGISQHADVILGQYRSEMHPEAHNAQDPIQPHVMEILLLKDRLSGQSSAFRSVPLIFEETGALRDAARGQL